MPKKKLTRFIVAQMIINNEEHKLNRSDIGMSVIIRNVGAETKEEAIGKFILQTNDIKCIKKLDVEVYELDNLKTID
jgi:hypothetical protein